MQRNPSTHDAKDDGDGLENVPERATKLKQLLLIDKSKSSESRQQEIMDMFYEEYEQDETAFICDLENIYRTAWLDCAIKLKASLNDPKFVSRLKQLSGINEENFREHEETVEELQKMYRAQRRSPRMYDVFELYPLENIDPRFAFLKNITSKFSFLSHFTHDFHNALLIASINNADYRDQKDAAPSQKDLRAPQNILSSHRQSLRTVEYLVAQITGEQKFEETNIQKFIEDFLNVITQRFQYDLRPYSGNEQGVAAEHPKSTVLVRFDPKLNDYPVGLEPNAMWAYLYNLFKNTLKEIKERNGWMICDVRMSEDERFLIIETTDNGEGFNITKALKSAWRNLQSDPGYEQYLRENLPGEVVETIRSWGDNPYAIRALNLPYGAMLDLFLLRKISGQMAQEETGETTFGIGMNSMKGTMKAHGGTVIISKSAKPGIGAKILTILPINPRDIVGGEVEKIRERVEGGGMTDLAA